MHTDVVHPYLSLHALQSFPGIVGGVENEIILTKWGSD